MRPRGRDKEPFDEGSGTAGILGQGFEEILPGSAWPEHARDRLRSREEAAYHKVLCAGWQDPACVLEYVRRWSGARELAAA